MTSLIHSVWSQYKIGEIAEEEIIRGGLINETYKITNKSGDVYVLQQLGGIFSGSLMQDISVITRHLEGRGWICPTPLETNYHQNFVCVESRLWRAYKYIPGKDISKCCRKGCDTYFECGKILGKLHQCLNSLDYRPHHKLEGFHEKEYYTNKALRINRDSYHIELQAIFWNVVEDLEKNSVVLRGPYQLIHGDPRVENIIFTKDGKSLTFIDYDTFMYGSVYVDIGDCLRSLFLLGGEVSLQDRLRRFMQGYNLENPRVTLRKSKVIKSLNYVILELTLRFIIDSVEQRYFSWDMKLYKTAADHNRYRAIEHWNLYKEVNKKL
jgi:Ser/Thr protein kinase RdoA (MazF antagonist)